MMISKIVEAVQAHRLDMILLGEMLHNAKNEAVWKTEIGAGIDTWYDFLAQPEIGMPVSEANFLIQLYNYAQKVGYGEVSRMPTGTVKYLMKHGGDVLDAQCLTTKDFKRKYYEDNHTKKADVVQYLVMKVLEDGTMERVYDGEELQVAKHQITNGERE
jgi:hypothetical protein